MFNQKNLLYYSTNEELDKPAPESENDFQGELHTATSVIAQVEDEEGAQEITKRVNMHDELVDGLKSSLKMFARGYEPKEGAEDTIGSKLYAELSALLKKAEQK